MRNDARDDFHDIPTLRATVDNQDEMEPTGGARECTKVYSRKTPAIKVNGPSTGPLWVLIGTLLLSVAGLAWWSFQQISLMKQQLVATQKSFAHISEDAVERLHAISGKVVASELSINNASEALKLQINQLEEQLLEQGKRQQGLVTGQQGELDSRFDQINSAMLMQVTAQKEGQARLEIDMKSLASELSTLKAGVAQQAVYVASLKKKGTPGAAIERLEQNLMVLKSEFENRPAQAQDTYLAEFDVLRSQVTRNTNTLQSQIQNLQKQISARP